MWDLFPATDLWQTALAVLPLALIVAAISKWVPCRPATRHTLWLMLLVWMVAAPYLPPLDLLGWDDLRSESLSTADPTWQADLDAKEEPIALEPPFRFGTPFADSRPSPAPVWTARPAFVTPPSNAGGLTTNELDDLIALDFLKEATRTESCLPMSLAQAADSVGKLPDGEESNISIDGSDFAILGVPNAEIHVESNLRADEESCHATSPCPADGDLFVSSSECGIGTASGLARCATVGAFIAQPEGQDGRFVDRWRLAESNEAATAPPPSSQFDASYIPSTEPFLGAAQPESDGAPAESVWRPWLLGVLRIRDAIFALPAIPTGVWLFGVVFLALLRGIGILQIRRLHRRATPVPDSVRALVADVSVQMGLRRAPRTLFMNENTSPHVFCWRDPHLLFPKGLWNQLDDAGRRAVICHELAHLRRRDHWVCWIDAIVGGLYWWHPLVWWIRRRLRVEAEYCCDAWVTWLLPRGRRAYAEALLLTKEFVGVQHGPQPRMGMAVGSGRAGTFRRRLTMVMTQTTKPRLSASGIALALVIAMAAWVATPARSCPPKPSDCVKDAQADCCKDVHADCCKGAPADCCKSAQKASAPYIVTTTDDDQIEGKEGLSSFQRYLVGRGAHQDAKGQYYVLAGSDDDDDDDLEDRLERLEERLERLAEHLEHLSGEPRADRPQRATRALRAPRTPRAPRAPRAPRTFSALPIGGFGAAGGDNIVRSYRFPEGRLEALTALMSLGDVQVLIRPGDDSIEVHGSTNVQSRFANFVNIISSGEEEVVSYSLSPGKLKLLTELMVRSDVPVIVVPSEDGIGVRGNPLVQSVFRAFVDMISGDELSFTPKTDNLRVVKEKVAKSKAKRKIKSKKKSKARGKGKAHSHDAHEGHSHSSHEGHGASFDAATIKEKVAKALHAAAQQKEQAIQSALAAVGSQGQMRELIDAATKMAVEARLSGSGRHEVAIENYVAAMMNQAEPFLSKAELLREQAEGLAHQSESLRAFAEAMAVSANRMRDKAADASDDVRRKLSLESDALTEYMEMVLEKAATIASQVGSIESVADQFELRADTFEQAADAFRAALDELAEHADARDDDN